MPTLIGVSGASAAPKNAGNTFRRYTLFRKKYFNGICPTYLVTSSASTSARMDDRAKDRVLCPKNNMLDRNSKVFFAIFFLTILLSIGGTYYTIVVERNYRTFTEDDVIPEPTDIYYDLFGYFKALGQ